MEEQPIIPRFSKPMFTQKMEVVVKGKISSPMELNRLLWEYSWLDIGLR